MIVPEEGAKHKRPLSSAGWGHSFWGWLAVCASVVLVALAVAGEILLHRVEPILKGRILETLRGRFGGRVELDVLHVSLLHGMAVTGGGLRIYPPDDVVAAGATAPLIAIRQFEFHAGLRGLFLKPTHVNVVHVQGLRVNIPPRGMRRPGKTDPRGGATQIEVDEILCDDSELVIGTEKPGAEPKRFEIQHIALTDVGPNAPWPYDATLTNAVPRGDIHAVGTFGPWNTESPGQSAITGRYEFSNADLRTIKGIGGTLRSVGTYGGRINQIEVKGTTDTPDFWLDSAKHRMPLETNFDAIVDGTTGDTYLQPVRARLGRSDFTCRGSVVNVKGVGHVIDMDVEVPAGRVQDFLELSVKTEPPVITGVLSTRAKLHLGPGKESVPEKLHMQGSFHLTSIQFSNPKVTDKIDDLSMRAQGYASAAEPGAPVVNSEIQGSYVMGGGKLNFSNLGYTIPGATVALAGVYSLDGEQFDFKGTVRTQAKLSDMVQTWWKQILLYPLNQVLQKNGAGMEIPVTISGTQGDPKFGLDLSHKNDPSHKNNNGVSKNDDGVPKNNNGFPTDRDRVRAKPPLPANLGRR